MGNQMGLSRILEFGHPLPSGPIWANEDYNLKASGGIFISPTFDLKSSLLSCRGVRLGPLREVIGPFMTLQNSGDTAPADFATLAEGHVNSGRFSRLSKFSKDVPPDDWETFWRACVLVADYRDWDNLVYPAPEIFGELARVYFGRKNIPEGLELCPGGEQAGFLEYVSPFSMNIDVAMVNRCFICTESGKWMGWGPMCARPGDIVAILFGGDFCFVLRPKGQHFELVGDAYAQGVMDGEFAKVNRETLAEEFVLC
jgi:hypothetical protein